MSSDMAITEPKLKLAITLIRGYQQQDPLSDPIDEKPLQDLLKEAGITDTDITVLRTSNISRMLVNPAGAGRTLNDFFTFPLLRIEQEFKDVSKSDGYDKFKLQDFLQLMLADYLCFTGGSFSDVDFEPTFRKLQLESSRFSRTDDQGVLKCAYDSL